MAGPQLFGTDYQLFTKVISRKCAKLRITPVFPADNLTRTSRAIYAANLELIRNCDGVIADLNPFRSEIEPDSGTAMECGFAAALGKPVVGIIEDRRNLLQKMQDSSLGCIENNNTYHSDEGDLIEDFDLPLNLMLFHSLEAVVGTMDEAIHFFDKRIW
ncbi:MAG: hypothetical protein BACD_02600 [Bacteroides rodentium]